MSAEGPLQWDYRVLSYLGLLTVIWLSSYFIFPRLRSTNQKLVAMSSLVAVLCSHMWYIQLPVDTKLYTVVTLSCTIILKTNQVVFFVMPYKPDFSFWNYLCEFLYYLFPLSWVPPSDRSSAFETINYSIFMLFYAAIKGVAASWFFVYFTMCLTPDEVAKTHHNWTSLTLYTGMWLCYIGLSTWTWDIFHSFINILSLGRYKLLRMNNRPLLAHSVRNFWSARYANLVRLFIHETIFMPIRKGLGASAMVAAGASWFATAVIHALGAYTAFGTGHWTTLWLFALQAIITGIETFLYRNSPTFKKSPIVLRVLLTGWIMFLTAPFYFGLFVQGAPGVLQQQNHSPGVWMNEVWKEYPWAHDRETMCFPNGVNNFALLVLLIFNVGIAIVQTVVECIEPTIEGAKKRAWDL